MGRTDTIRIFREWAAIVETDVGSQQFLNYLKGFQVLLLSRGYDGALAQVRLIRGDEGEEVEKLLCDDQPLSERIEKLKYVMDHWLITPCMRAQHDVVKIQEHLKLSIEKCKLKLAPLAKPIPTESEVDNAEPIPKESEIDEEDVKTGGGNNNKKKNKKNKKRQKRKH